MCCLTLHITTWMTKGPCFSRKNIPKKKLAKKKCSRSDHLAHNPASNCGQKWMPGKECKNRAGKGYFSIILSFQWFLTQKLPALEKPCPLFQKPTPLSFLQNVKPAMSLTVWTFCFLRQSSRITCKCSLTKLFPYRAGFPPATLLAVRTWCWQAEPSYLHCCL